MLPAPQTWLASWLTHPLAAHPGLDPAPVLSAMVPAITAYSAWHAEDGLLALQKQVRRMSRDTEQADEIAVDTYLDVRERLEQCVARAARGRSLPTFQSVEGVRRYHRIQARLRIQKRWSPRRKTVNVDDVTLSTAPRIEQLVSIAQHALPLRFAACWALADLSRRGQKDACWWWAMLRHGLDLQKVDNLHGARNDPGEAVDRLRVRLAAARGMRPWLKQWAAHRPGWQALSVALPSQCPDPAPVVATLPALRRALDSSVDRLQLNTVEAAALRRVLVRGRTIRTSLHDFTGDDPRARMTALAEAAGSALCAGECAAVA